MLRAQGRIRRRLALAWVVALASAAVLTTASASGAVVAGRWGAVLPAPTTVEGTPVSVWTGKLMIVFGRHHLAPTAQFPDIGRNVNVALAYNPGTNHWRQLTPPLGPTGAFEGRFSSVWTGKEMLVWGPFTVLGYNPSTNHWRQLPASPFGMPAGIVVWTGREMIGWGGGCCGDASNEGAAYNPATNTWRKLAASPLHPSQGADGAWTGRELLLFIGPSDVDGKPVPALARAAAYDPATDTWRTLAPEPAPRENAVWDGRELLLVGGTIPSRQGGPPALALVGLAYDPATNHWRRLPRMESGRTRAAAVWTGKRLLLWGGQSASDGTGESVTPSHGLAYDPGANRWSALPPARLLGRSDPVAVWTGHLMLVWGGNDPYFHPLTDGARFRPATP